jgi:ABC-type nitrate/sulfonate/bicarbonate transport system substrate-binding protein
VSIESAGFAHLQNLQSGYDGAWLCFANFEGVQARLAGMDLAFIDSVQVGLRNFSALELFTGLAFLSTHPIVVAKVFELVERGAALCRDDPALAAHLWYPHTGEQANDLTDAIIADACPRLVGPMERNAPRWRPMWAQFEAMGLARVDQAGYEAPYSV